MKEKEVAQKTILLVDDDLSYFKPLVEHMKLHFSEILMATNGIDGLHQLASHSVDIVISDFQMPGMNGLLFYNQVRKKYPLIPFLFLTGQCSDPELFQCLDLGVFDIIEKPYRSSVLIHRIQNAILYSKLLEAAWLRRDLEKTLFQKEDFYQISFIQKLKLIESLSYSSSEMISHCDN